MKFFAEKQRIRKGRFALSSHLDFMTDNDDIWEKPTYIFALDIDIIKYNFYLELQIGGSKE